MSALTEPAAELFSPEARESCRSAIAGHHGNEVFFVATLEAAGGRVASVEVLCLGGASAVPALLDRPEPGQVVIHNHPSGMLRPSDADVQLAGHFGNNDVGFYIIDNEATRVCPVVRPRRPEPRVEVERAGIEAVLGPSGALSKILPGFESRTQQVEMGALIARAFNEERIALVEAGTGTGKSLGYLVPAALWALGNKGRVIVSTHTINLQEQLSTKDVPLLQRLAGMGIEAAVLKGRGNYLCLRKLEQGQAQPGLFEDEESGPLRALGEWASRTTDGTRSDLSLQLPDDLWERVQADPDDCNRVQCPAYERCFYFTARRKAASAQLLIVNHHLLLADLFLRAEMGDYKKSIILPAAQHVILDEAHHLEDVATSFGSGKVSARGLLRQLRRLFRIGRGRTLVGLLPALRDRLGGATADETEGAVADAVEQKLLPLVEECSRAAAEHLQSIGQSLEGALRAEGSRAEATLRIRPSTTHSPLWVELWAPVLEDLFQLLGRLVRTLGDVLTRAERLPRAETEPLKGLLLDVGGIRNKLTSQTKNLRAFLTPDDNLVRWMELERGRGRNQGTLSARLCLSPIDVAALLHDRIFKPMKTVVLTSATLTAGGSFDYFRGRVGLSQVPPPQIVPDPVAKPVASRLDPLSIPSPFDLARQVFFGVPSDLPVPSASGASPGLADLVEEAVDISQGAAFVLFTSYGSLEAVYRRISEGGRVPWALLKQGEAARTTLLERFRDDTHAVLFGADSFWEGVDVQGEALRLVILTRLPFRVPSEPVFEARCEAVEAAGGDPFRQLSLPQAVIRFKQGFGRLIRHREDWGAVLVTDPRILTKPYGRTFLAAVPQVSPLSGDTGRVLSAMATFFQARLGGGPADSAGKPPSTLPGPRR